MLSKILLWCAYIFVPILAGIGTLVYLFWGLRKSTTQSYKFYPWWALLISGKKL